jgi:hypothetical protein
MDTKLASFTHKQMQDQKEQQEASRADAMRVKADDMDACNRMLFTLFEKVPNTTHDTIPNTPYTHTPYTILIHHTPTPPKPPHF